MKVRHDEGVANRIGPEPCVGIREDDDEASAGERIGQLWSRESLKVSGADVVGLTEGNMDGRAIASARPNRRGQRHCVEALLPIRFAANHVAGCVQSPL